MMPLSFPKGPVLSTVIEDFHELAESRFTELMTQIFQRDEASSLDFGIYRVIRRLNAEIQAFFGDPRTVPGTVVGGKLHDILDATFRRPNDAEQLVPRRLAELSALIGVSETMTASETEAALQVASRIPAAAKYVAEFRELLASSNAKNANSEDRAIVLNHLFQFFSSQFQDGDFIVQRRYGKNGARYIKSIGEDWEFRWATEGMYYIKSGDVFSDFKTTLSSGRDVTFSLVESTLKSTRDVLRPNDSTHYELFDVQIDENNSAIVRLSYLKGAQTEGQKASIVSAAQIATSGNPVEIRRALNRFVARNQSDFFIHKDLRAALLADFEVFVKTNVFDLDQMLQGASDVRRLSRIAEIASVVKTVGEKIIDFLATIENFKKLLWEKKKLVLETRYIITLDRLAGYDREWLDANLENIVRTQAQAWEELGLGSYKSGDDCRAGAAGEIDKYLPLPIDTAFFERRFCFEMLDHISQHHTLYDEIDGWAIKSDNWQALNTLEETFKNRSKCVYIDPPYNTDAGGIPYKNGYRHASWIAMMENRVQKLHSILSQDGAIFVSIDKVERTPLEQLLDRVFGNQNRIEELIWVQNTNDGKSPTYSTNHEFIEVYAKQRAAVESDRDMFREPKPGYQEIDELIRRLNPEYPSVKTIESEIKSLFKNHLIEYRNEIESLGLDWSFEKSNDPWKGLYNYSRAEYRDKSGRLIPESQARELEARIWVWRESDWTIMSSETKQSESTRDPRNQNFRYYQPLHPITGMPMKLSARGWKGTQFIDPAHPERNSYESLLADDRIAFGEDETKVFQHKRMLHEVDTNVAKSVFTDYSDGEKQTAQMFGKSGLFLAPKSTRFVSRVLEQGSSSDSLIVDCFGGSGSTAHAVVELNRAHNSNRKFVTVEVNKYFDTLVVPRITKAGSATQWRSGKALDIDGSGLFFVVQRLEQYDDTLENLRFEDNVSLELPFETDTARLRYRMEAALGRILFDSKEILSPFGYTIKSASRSGVLEDVEVDLIHSASYLLGMQLERLIPSEYGVAMLGTSRRGEFLGVFFREVEKLGSGHWVEKCLSEFPVHKAYSNAVGELQFDGAQNIDSIESVFASQFLVS